MLSQKTTRKINRTILDLMSLGLISLICFSAEASQQIQIWRDSRFNLPRKSGAVLFKLKKNKTLADIQSRVQPSSLIPFSVNMDLNAAQLLSSSIYELHFSTPMADPELSNHAEEAYAKKLMETGLVEFAEPDYIITPDVVANDPDLSTQWYLQKISAPAAWEITTGSYKTQVLVCDTGVMSNHPDLKENVINQGHNFADDSNNTEPSGNPHGTLVAGLIGAKGNNGIGIAGLNWEVQIIPGKISNDVKGAAQTSTMVKCIQWAIDHHIRVVNLSYSGTESDAIREASKTLFENNGMLIDTIGNAGLEVTRPANPYALTVGASDYYDFKPPWSNTGDALDLVAPGASILSTDGNGDYKNVQGTSFAAPLVTGTVALLISLNPDRPMSEIRQMILDSVKDLGTAGKDKAFGYGRLDIDKAIQLHKAFPVSYPMVR
ncbi:MAG: S8 family peptidase [Pseudobdellovibrionaceae bacterium]